MKYNPITRRMFLQGAGGYALAIPFLSSLAPQAHAQSAPATRFAMVLGKYGRDMSQWYPNVAEAQFQISNGIRNIPFSQLPRPLSHCLNTGFDPILSKMSLVRGLDCLSTQGNHNSSVPTTGSSVKPDTSVGFGYSIDCVLEESSKFYSSVPSVGALRVCPDVSAPWHEFASFSYTSKTVHGQMITPEWNALNVYNSLLNPTSVQTANSRRARLRSVTNFVMENFKQTMNSRTIASEDKMRLDNYMGLLSDTHNQISVALKSCGGVSAPGTPSTKVLSDFHKAMMKMEVAALACGVTKITMHSIAHNADILDPMWHQYAHGGENTIDPSTGRSYLSAYCRWNMDLVAFFLNEMNQIQEGDGTLLDNTLFIYGNEDGTGSHEHFDLPVIVAGGKGKLKLGHYIDYRQRPFIPLMQRQKQVINVGRPYNSMLVTAFQALGLGPADYQKFGMQGFGRYDKLDARAGNVYASFLGAKVNDPLPFLWNG